MAARGLDIPNVDLVVHYELPMQAEAFLHRSGRTGRAGKSGITVGFVTPEEYSQFQRILKVGRQLCFAFRLFCSLACPLDSQFSLVCFLPGLLLSSLLFQL